jgi:hypothetical protein
MSRQPALRLLALGTSLALLGVVGYRWHRAGAIAEPPPLPPAASAAPSAARPPTSSNPPVETAAAVSIHDVAPPADTALLSGEAALEAITDLAVTYDAASVPALARYLAHPDAETRAAARDGLVQLGERAAIPFLATAAKTAAPDETKALLEAAEFLALPSWTEVRKASETQPPAATP